MSSARQVWEFAQNFSQKHSVHVLVSVRVIGNTCSGLWLLIAGCVLLSDQQCRMYGESARADRGGLGEELRHEYAR